MSSSSATEICSLMTKTTKTAAIKKKNTEGGEIIVGCQSRAKTNKHTLQIKPEVTVAQRKQKFPT